MLFPFSPRSKSFLLILIALGLAFLMKSQLAKGRESNVSHQPLNAPKPIAVVSVAPYSYILNALIGQEIDCICIVPPANDPHHFSPTVSHIADLKKADLAFLTGEPCERQFLASLDQNHNVKLLDLRTTCSLLPAPSSCQHHHHQAENSSHHFKFSSLDAMDTHLWLSPSRLIDQSIKIAQVLKSRFPEKCHFIDQNQKRLIEALRQLDDQLRLALRTLKMRALLVSHPALTYFCQDYQIEQLSAEFEGRLPAAYEQTQLFQMIQKHKLDKILIIQPHGEKAARQIAKSCHLKISHLNPYSADPIAVMKQICSFLTDNSL